MSVIGCVGVTYWLNCYLLENYRLCRCNVLIVILGLAHYKLRRCNVLIELLLLDSLRLCRCSVLIVILMLVKCRLCRCSVLVEMLLFANVGLRLECCCLLIIGCVVCCVAIGILLLESFRSWRCNALTSVCYYCSSLTFEVEKAWCTDCTGTSGWVIVE